MYQNEILTPFLRWELQYSKAYILWTEQFLILFTKIWGNSILNKTKLFLKFLHFSVNKIIQILIWLFVTYRSHKLSCEEISGNCCKLFLRPNFASDVAIKICTIHQESNSHHHLKKNKTTSIKVCPQANYQGGSSTLHVRMAT